MSNNIKTPKNYLVRNSLFIIRYSIFCFLIACNNGGQPSEENDNSPLAPGKKVYQTTCVVCHQPDGAGVTGIYPPLAQSDYLLADKNRAIHQVLKGSSGEIKVNGKTFHSLMPPQGGNLKDDEIAAVLNYVYHSFGNNGFTITAADVKAVRDTVK
ncbi:MAG: c-type cytochrome [Bacteroidia bacterium]